MSLSREDSQQIYQRLVREVLDVHGQDSITKALDDADISEVEELVSIHIEVIKALQYKDVTGSVQALHPQCKLRILHFCKWIRTIQASKLSFHLTVNEWNNLSSEDFDLYQTHVGVWEINHIN
jgi:hypothetical protein